MAAQELAPQEKLQCLQDAVQRSNNEALIAIQSNYEIVSGDAHLYFHTRPHTRGVIRRSRLIGEAVHEVIPHEVSETDIEVIVFGAGRHDEIQISKPVEVTVTDDFGAEWQVIKRQRATGENEKLSAAIAQTFAERELLPQELITQHQLDGALRGIDLTKPTFDMALHTVVQPGFADDENPFIAQTIALADLAATGMHEREVAIYEAAALFWEDFIGVRRYKEDIQINGRRSARVDSLTVEAFYKQLLLDWLEQQTWFIQGRQQLVWGEIDSMHITRSGRNAIKGLFHDDNFTDAIKTIEELRNELSYLSFEDCSQKLDKIVTAIPLILQ